MKERMRPGAGSRQLWLVLTAAICSLGGHAAAGANSFFFVVPGDDATPSASDFSKLSPGPAGAEGFVRIQDGHFVTDSGRLRLWGVNTCFGANFPAHDDAEKAAAHLAKLGVNAVRMHHHDTDASPRGVWGRTVDGHRTLDPDMLERQDYFIDQLNRHGIYVDLNLHVGRTFTEAEGFSTKGLPRAVEYSKYLIYFEPRMRELFKQFCREYLTHTNGCRKLRRVDDPGIAVIEISNENSFSTLGPDIAAELPEPYRGEFKGQWNRWLAGHYASTAALQKAWGANNEPLGPLLAAPVTWAENLGGWWLHQSQEYPVALRFDQPGPTSELKALRLDLQKPAPEISLQELQLPNLKLEPAHTYTLSFWVKADANRPLYVDVSNQGPGNWNSVGLGETVPVGATWRRVVRPFLTSDKLAAPVRICFKFGDNPVGFSLAEVRLQRGGEFIVVPPGQGLEQHNIEIPTRGWCEGGRQDVRRFMVDTEKGFIRDMMRFLKEDLGVRVPITASQITYHGAEIVADTCDYADIHAYWQHPHFPGRPWDGANWTIANTPMECAPESDSLLSRAPWRLLDRPFTMSEWNIPDPNDYAASVVPFAAMVAALQDWDGVFFFDYHSSQHGWFDDRIHGYFSFNGQPAKLALLGACANLYRRADLKPLPQVAAGTLEHRLPATWGLSYRIGIDPKAKERASAAGPNGKRLSSPEGNIVWDATERARAHVQISTPALRAVWGLIAGQHFDLGGVEVTVGPTDRDYAVLVLTSLDGRPLESAQRILLAAVGSAENTGMVWNAARTSVGTHWGEGPTQVNGIPAEFVLPFRVGSVKALDGRGEPREAVPVSFDGKASRFSIGPAQQTLWYAVTKS